MPNPDPCPHSILLLLAVLIRESLLSVRDENDTPVAGVGNGVVVQQHGSDLVTIEANFSENKENILIVIKK